MTRIARLRDLLRMRWLRGPVTDHEAGQVLARCGVEAKRRAELTIQERKEVMTARLRAECEAGLVCGRPAR